MAKVHYQLISFEVFYLFLLTFSCIFFFFLLPSPFPSLSSNLSRRYPATGASVAMPHDIDVPNIGSANRDAAGSKYILKIRVDIRKKG